MGRTLSAGGIPPMANSTPILQLLWILPLLFLTGLYAEFVDSIAAGGGLITLPVLLNVGISPEFALGTNKLQATFGSGSAAWHFAFRHFGRRAMGSHLNSYCDHATPLPQTKDRQSCLAHIKTKAKELERELALLEGKAADPAARQFCQKIQGFVHATCQAHQQLSKGPWRAQAAKKKGQALRRQLQALCKNPLQYERAEAFRQRLRGPEQKNFFTCFRHPKVPPTNNQAERSLRPVVIMRKIIHGTRSDKGLENHGVLRSLFETARRQGKKPRQFFLGLFTKSTAEAQAALYRRAATAKPRPTLRR